MNILVVFKEALSLPVENNEILETYGLVINQEKWDPSPYKLDYLSFVRVISEITKDGFKSEDLLEFEKDGYYFYWGDLTWNSFEKAVEECGVPYAIVGDFDELDDGDCHGEYFKNKEKWEKIVNREGLDWRR